MNFGGRFLAGSSVSKAATQYKGHTGPTPIAQRWHKTMIEDGLTNPSQGPHSELYQGMVPANVPNRNGLERLLEMCATVQKQEMLIQRL